MPPSQILADQLTLSKPKGKSYAQHIRAPPPPSYGPALLPKECQLVVFVTFVNCQVDVNWQKKGWIST